MIENVRASAKDVVSVSGGLLKWWTFRGTPVGMHLRTAWIRSRVQGAVRQVPDHVLENVRTAFGDGMSRSDVLKIGRGYLEFAQRRYLGKVLPRHPGFKKASRWPIEGLEQLDQALAQERGVMLASAHFGHVRLIAPILRSYGYSVALVVSGHSKRMEKKEKKVESSRDLSRLGRSIYERSQIRIDPVASGDIIANLDVRPIFSALAANMIVIIMGDGMRAAEFYSLPFLKVRYPFPAGFIKLGLISEAPILPVFASERDTWQILTRVGPPLAIDPVAPIEANLMTYVKCLEAEMSSAPHLWHRWSIRNLFEKASRWAESDIRVRYSHEWRTL